MDNVKNVAYGTHVTVIDKVDSELVKLRVAAYARVSSDSEDQINSYIAQVDFYTKYITAHEGWELVDIYADEGLTGMETKHRDEFNRMIRDCRDGKIDRVLVKSVSRFARNTQEYILYLYMRELLRLGISIYFEKEHLDTGKMTSEQNAAIYGAFAQMESTGRSQNMRVSNRIRMEKGLFTASHPPYGYRLQGNELVIIPEEAEVVKLIFNSFINGTGKQGIVHELSALGIKKNSKSGKWNRSSLDYILSNPAYTGTQIWQKTYATDVIPFKQVKNNGQKPKYYVENCCPPIISTEEFDLAQAFAGRRKGLPHTKVNEASIYRGHLQCSVCGRSCKTKIVRQKRYLICCNRSISKERCEVPAISEDEVTLAVHRFIRKLKSNNMGILRAVVSNLHELHERELKNNAKIANVDMDIAKLAERNHVLAKLKAKGYMDSALYISEQNEINRKLFELRKARTSLVGNNHEDTIIDQTERMIEYLESLPDDSNLLDSRIYDDLIEKILLAPDKKIIMVIPLPKPPLHPTAADASRANAPSPKPRRLKR